MGAASPRVVGSARMDVEPLVVEMPFVPRAHATQHAQGESIVVKKLSTALMPRRRSSRRVWPSVALRTLVGSRGPPVEFEVGQCELRQSPAIRHTRQNETCGVRCIAINDSNEGFGGTFSARDRERLNVSW